MPQPAHRMAPRTAVLPVGKRTGVGKGTGGSSQDEPVGGNSSGSQHREKTNLELWADQPYSTSALALLVVSVEAKAVP